MYVGVHTGFAIGSMMSIDEIRSRHCRATRCAQNAAPKTSPGCHAQIPTPSLQRAVFFAIVRSGTAGHRNPNNGELHDPHE